MVPLIVVLFASCNHTHKTEEKIITTNHYFFDTANLFGTEVVLKYEDDKLSESSILVQEKTFRTDILYYFVKDSIIAREIKVTYKYPMTDRHIILNDSLYAELIDSDYFTRYILDYDGNVIWIDDSSKEINNFYLLFDSLLPAGIMRF